MTYCRKLAVTFVNLGFKTNFNTFDELLLFYALETMEKSTPLLPTMVTKAVGTSGNDYIIYLFFYRKKIANYHQ